jgi:transposase InsO family protein
LAIQTIQTDNSSSFGPQFTWHLSDLRISHKHIPPGCPEVNGKVERSHKTDSEEFHQERRFKHKRDLARKLKRWETDITKTGRISHSREKRQLNEFANSFSHPEL